MIRFDNTALIIEGALTQQTVVEALNQSIKQLPTNTVIQVNFEGVTHSDSASLAFLMALLREAKKKSVRLQFVELPKQMLELARVSGVLSVLPMAAQ